MRVSAIATIFGLLAGAVFLGYYVYTIWQLG
jgi:hypothetical protein